MEFKEIYKSLNHFYKRIDPHHETWMLWLKKKEPIEVFEVAVGTILVQNTSWRNVEITIANLFAEGIDSFVKLSIVNFEILEKIIKPAGFFKQKSRYLKGLADLLTSFKLSESQYPSRKELLDVKGIGRETADSLLVYCFYKPFPIVGVYTRRFLTRMCADEEYLKIKYEKIQEQIKNELPADYFILGKFHALIVAHCQKFCQKNRPKCNECFLNQRCIYGREHETDSKIADIQVKICNKKKKK